MVIMYHTNRGGQGAIWISDLFQCHFKSCKLLAFLAYNFLLKRDTATGMVSLCSVYQDLLVDIHIKFLRSPFGLKGTLTDVKI